MNGNFHPLEVKRRNKKNCGRISMKNLCFFYPKHQSNENDCEIQNNVIINVISVIII